MPDWQWVGITQ
jgi:hypothetical protein